MDPPKHDDLSRASCWSVRDLICVKLLGSGSFGDVYKAYEINEKCYFAVKKICLEKLVYNKVSLVTMSREVVILVSLSHPNIVRYFSSWFDGPNTHGKDWLGTLGKKRPKIRRDIFGDVVVVEENFFFIKMELCHTDLSTLLKKRIVLQSLREIWEIRNKMVLTEAHIQVCDALDYIHSKRIIHRDIWPKNIFLTFPQNTQPYNFATLGMIFVKLGDFGLSRMVNGDDKSLTQYVGCGLYRAPEVDGWSEERLYTTAADIYSHGLVLMETFHHFDTDAGRRSLLYDLKDHRKKGYIPPPQFAKNFPEICTLVGDMVQYEGTSRPTAGQVGGRLRRILADMKKAVVAKAEQDGVQTETKFCKLPPTPRHRRRSLTGVFSTNKRFLLRNMVLFLAVCMVKSEVLYPGQISKSAQPPKFLPSPKYRQISGDDILSGPGLTTNVDVPWTAVITLKNEFNRTLPAFPGILIGDNLVLTTASAFLTKGRFHIYPISNYAVSFGTRLIRGFDTKPARQVRKITQIRIHPDFKNHQDDPYQAPYEHDFALIFLYGRITPITNLLDLIALPSSLDDDLIDKITSPPPDKSDSEDIILSGWDKTDPENLFLRLKIETRWTCSAESWYSSEDINATWCGTVGKANMHTSCPFKSVAAARKINGTYFLAGTLKDLTTTPKDRCPSGNFFFFNFMSNTTLKWIEDNRSCGAGYFTCSDSSQRDYCVDLDKVCDQKMDCVDGSDEDAAYCRGIHYCRNDQIACGVYGRCIDTWKVKEGIDNCDQPDPDPDPVTITPPPYSTTTQPTTTSTTMPPSKNDGKGWTIALGVISGILLVLLLTSIFKQKVVRLFKCKFGSLLVDRGNREHQGFYMRIFNRGHENERSPLLNREESCVPIS